MAGTIMPESATLFTPGFHKGLAVFQDSRRLRGSGEAGQGGARLRGFRKPLAKTDALAGPLDRPRPGGRQACERYAGVTLDREVPDRVIAARGVGSEGEDQIPPADLAACILSVA